LTGFTGISGFLDSQSFGFPPGGSVATIDGALDAATGNFHSTGDIVQFGYTLATPEPASWAMILIGMAGLGLLARRRAMSSGRV
jgi:hypothetical protein